MPLNPDLVRHKLLGIEQAVARLRSFGPITPERLGDVDAFVADVETWLSEQG